MGEWLRWVGDVVRLEDGEWMRGQMGRVMWDL